MLLCIVEELRKLFVFGGGRREHDVEEVAKDAVVLEQIAFGGVADGFQQAGRSVEAISVN